MSTLGQQLQDRGFTVDDNPAYGRTSQWDRVRWVVLHHYAGSENPADATREAAYLRTGGTYPPNAQLYVDLTGKVWVICKERPGQAAPGRATHMGSGEYPGIQPNRGNEVCLGIEVQCDGMHPLATHGQSWPVVLRLMAELLDLYQLPTDRLIGHKEYAGRAQGKVDPRDDMAQVRRQVQQIRDDKTNEEAGVGTRLVDYKAYNKSNGKKDRPIKRGRWQTIIEGLDPKDAPNVEMTGQFRLRPLRGVPGVWVRFVRRYPAGRLDGTGDAWYQWPPTGGLPVTHRHTVKGGPFKVDVQVKVPGEGEAVVFYAYGKLHT